MENQVLLNAQEKSGNILCSAKYHGIIVWQLHVTPMWLPKKSFINTLQQAHTLHDVSWCLFNRGNN
ncbi:hypothetical protein BIW11_07987, partial [Tropilaelaps mercedesae]